MNLCYNSIFLPGFVGKSILGTDQAPTGSRPLVHPCPFWKKSKVHPQIYHSGGEWGGGVLEFVKGAILFFC